MPSNDRTGGHGLGPEDFESIRDAVMETPRGRWFLTEYASRVRSSETAGLLDGMQRIEMAVTANHDALMARLAEALKEPLAPAAPQPSALSQRHMKYFRQDEEIFEPAPPSRIAAVADAPRPGEDAKKGATVVIRRSEPEEPLAAPEPQQSQPQPVAAAPPPPVQAEAEALPRRRIVIIRHKPGEDVDVPLHNEMAQTG